MNPEEFFRHCVDECLANEDLMREYRQAPVPRLVPGAPSKTAPSACLLRRLDEGPRKLGSGHDEEPQQRHEPGKVSKDVAKWAIEHGDDPDLRIALCGYDGEHEMPSTWTCHAWKAHRGYANEDNENKHRERIWFSPHCLPIESAQAELFREVTR